MKRFLTLLVSALLITASCFSLVACSNPDNDDGGKNPPASQTEIKYVESSTQFNALTEVSLDSADVAVTDKSFFAFHTSAKGQLANKGLTILENSLTDNKTKSYAFATRKGSNIPLYLNAALYELQQNGTLEEIAKSFCLENLLPTIPEPEVTFENLPTPEKGSDWANIVDTGYLKVGYDLNENGADNNNPFVSRGQTYAADNLEPKILAKISKLFGLEYDEYYNSDDYGLLSESLIKCTAANQFIKLENGEVDILMNRMNAVDYANENADFTTPFLNDKLVLVVKGTAPTFDSLKDKKFTASKGTLGETTIKNDINNYFFK